MKKMLFSVCVLSLSFLIACNNDPIGEPPSDDSTGKTQKAAPAATEATALKDHVCSDKCEDGNHFYAHGERGHICTDECMKEHKM